MAVSSHYVDLKVWMSIIFFHLRHSSSIKSVIEEFLPVTAAFLIDRSFERRRWLSLFLAPGKARNSDAVRTCTEIHKICAAYFLNLQWIYENHSMRVLLAPDRFIQYLHLQINLFCYLWNLRCFVFNG